MSRTMANFFDPSWLAGGIISLLLGPDLQTWNVHEKLLVHNSPYFARLLSAKDAAGEKKTEGLAAASPAPAPAAYGHFGQTSSPVQQQPQGFSQTSSRAQTPGPAQPQGYGGHITQSPVQFQGFGHTPGLSHAHGLAQPHGLGQGFGPGAGPANTPTSHKNSGIMLPDIDPKLFNMFLRWGYGNAFATAGNTGSFRLPAPSNDPDGASVRDYLGVYVLGYKLECIGLRNACLDVLYDHLGPATADHLCLAMKDVAFVFENTPKESPMRRFLTAHLLFYMFCLSRRGSALPEEWGTVLEKGDFGISWTLIRMLGDWNWAMGDNVPVMIIRPRSEFYEKTAAQKQRLRHLASLGRIGSLPDEGENSTRAVMIKREEGAVGQSGLRQAATSVQVLQGEAAAAASQETTAPPPARQSALLGGTPGPRVGPVRANRRFGRGGPGGGDHPAEPYHIDG
ncbi:hypothetical protein QBC41DRAFT_342957 [Cercophora samala]|uniref:BTB domain-containing protein n=1 Tax=Cercophora samala TaxID=330535 RepID=A0AA39ZM23_9PEZI|nr:hypothetical protein QBC41DRAFT_342957 [Cercophora samala]